MDSGGAVDSGKPRTWERPGRPAPNADGGAPKPRAGAGDEPDRPAVDTEWPAAPGPTALIPRCDNDRPTASESGRRPPDERRQARLEPAPRPTRKAAAEPDRPPVVEEPRPERREPDSPR